MDEEIKRRKILVEMDIDEPQASPEKTAADFFSDRKYFGDGEPLSDEDYKKYVDKMTKKLEKKTLGDFFKEALFAEKEVGTGAALNHISQVMFGCNLPTVSQVYKDWVEANPPKTDKHPRMVSVGFQIRQTTLSHRYDLECFSKRVHELFNWWDEPNEEKKFLGPYMCFVQSSGMGKTKLMYEYKLNQLNKSAHERVAAFLVLPTCTMFNKDEEGVFDYGLDLEVLGLDVLKTTQPGDLLKARKMVHAMLDDMLQELTQTNVLTDKRIALLFDESHFLLDEHLGFEAFLFRCIRVWLREKRPHDQRVVGVFAGTSSRLANFIVASDSKIQANKAPSRDHELEHREYAKRGHKFNPPFYTTTTMGCRLTSRPSDCGSTGEYDRAVYHGRPLFAVMAQDGILDQNLSVVLTRMLLLNTLVKEWDINSHALINLLSTRVQMGQMTMAVTSDLVAKAYANLSGYFEESGAAQLAYLPDPVCARLAMCLMDEDCAPALNIGGKAKRWWANKLKEIFSSGIVSPEKGDFGEVIVALYMLFCGDLLRKRFNNDNHRMTQKAYVQFSVSLDEWLQMLQSGGKLPDATSSTTTISEADKTSKVSVGFIQVCRNSLRSYGKSWTSLDNDFLKQVYESGTAFYVYPGCPLIDLVIPLRVTTRTESEFEFVPMLVSIKCRSSFGPGAAQTVCNKMEEKARDANLTRALCLLIIFGSEDGDKSINSTVEAVSERLMADVVTRVIRVPRNDEFGLSEVFKVMTPTAQVLAELFGSHPFLKAHGDRTDEENMRSTSSRASYAEYDRLRQALIN